MLGGNVNVLEFVSVAPESDGGVVGINVRVDGRFLAEIIKDVEMPMAKAEGNASIAGAYAAIPMPDDLKKHFLGAHSMAWGENGNKTLLLDCECGQPGCWPLLCEIEISADLVAWKNFEQPHRGPRSKASHWDYAHFDGFIFDRTQYFEALANITNAH